MTLRDDLAALHRPVQWKGWRLFAQRIGRQPLAFVDEWCAECRKEWPCPTGDIITKHSTGGDRG